MKPTLHILTTCFRLQNLPILANHIAPAKQWFDLCWRIVFDGTKIPRDRLKWCEPILRLPHVKWSWVNQLPFWGDTKLNPTFKRGWAPCVTAANNLIWEVDEGWLWINDDDNIAHPGLFQVLRQHIDDSPNIKGWIFAMEGHGWRRPAKASDVRVGQIDIGQYALERSVIGDSRYKFLWGFDGMFIEEVYRRNPTQFGFDNRILTYHNWLRDYEYRKTQTPQNAPRHPLSRLRFDDRRRHAG